MGLIAVLGTTMILVLSYSVKDLNWQGWRLKKQQ